MAEISDFAVGAGGIPLGLIQGYNYGQKAQRDEEKALADIEQARLRNELLGIGVSEFGGAEQTAQRATATELQTLLNRLGITTSGYNLEVAQQQGPTIMEGLTAQTQAAAANQRLLAERANLGLELFPGQAAVARGVSAQDVSLLPETLRIREAGQREKAGTIESSLRRLDELTLQSGAVDTIRKAYAANPNAAPFDVMWSAYQTAPDGQKAIIAARLQIQNQNDLVAVTTPEALDQWLQRPLQQFRGRSWVNQDGTISIATETGRVNEQGQKTYSQPVVVRDMEEAKNLFGQRVPAGTRQPTTKAAPVTGSALANVATAGTGVPTTTTAAPAARGGPAVTPTRTPAAAPSPLGAIAGPPAAQAAAAPAVSQTQMFFTSAPTATIQAAAARGIPGALEELQRRIQSAKESETALQQLIGQAGIPGA